MPHDAHLSEFLQASQILDSCARILGEVGGGGIGKDTCRGGRATVVVAQTGNAMAGKPVGEQEEGLVLEQLLIAVLRPAARHHEHHRTFFLLIAHRISECASQSDIGGRVDKGHLLCRVGERRLRFLWTVESHLSRLEVELESHSLPKSTLQLAIDKFSRITDVGGLDDGMNGVGRKPLHLHGQIVGPLFQNIK